jgi:hypothetical protein
VSSQRRIDGYPHFASFFTRQLTAYFSTNPPCEPVGISDNIDFSQTIIGLIDYNVAYVLYAVFHFFGIVSNGFLVRFFVKNTYFNAIKQKTAADFTPTAVS